MAVALVAISLLPVTGGSPLNWWFAGGGVGFGVFALVYPNALSPFNRVWTLIGLLLHKITNPIILGAIFFLVLWPTGLVMRAVGYDPLRLRKSVDCKSYWLTSEVRQAGDMSRQF